jgi:cytochrome c
MGQPATTAAGGTTGATPTAGTTPTTGASPAPSGKAGTAFADQAARGQQLFAQQCAECHGASGEGGKTKSGKAVPKLVGLTAGALPENPPATAKVRKTPFKTVGDVATFVQKFMPQDAPGSLTQQQVYDVLAFDLKANGIDLKDKQLDAQSATTMEIPRH